MPNEEPASSGSLTSMAPNSAGMASRKAKRAESSRSTPRARPAPIVEPDREMPGSIDIACATPMTRASGTEGATAEAFADVLGAVTA